MRSALRRLLLSPGSRSSSLVNGLNGYWALEEPSGTRFDGSGNGNNLTSNNNVGQAVGKVGNAASLVAASSQWLSVASNPTLQLGTGSLTIAAWVQLASLPTTGQRFAVFKGDSSNTNLWEYALLFQGGTPGSLRFRMGNGVASASTSVTFSNPLTATWYFCLAWYDAIAQTVNLRVNNGTASSQPYTPGGYASTGALSLGSGNALAGSYWDGLLDEVGLWNRALTIAEQTALWNGGVGTSFPFSGLGV